MKPKNFPARKLARQLAAELQGWNAKQVREEFGWDDSAITAARNRRSKKRRASV